VTRALDALSTEELDASRRTRPYEKHCYPRNPPSPRCFVTPSTPPELRVVLDTQVLLRGAMAKTVVSHPRSTTAWRDDHFVLLLSEQ